jgi:arachidonate 15-lipoxygenase
MKTPLLPQRDPYPRNRELELATRRERYRFDYAYPAGVAVAAELPTEAEFSMCMAASVAKIQMQATQNAMESDLLRPRSTASRTLTFSLDQLKSIIQPGLLAQVIGTQLQTITNETRSDSPRAVTDYNALYATIARPAVADVFEQDWVFAWQRIAGANPMVLRRLGTPDVSGITLDDALFQRIAEHQYGPRYRDQRVHVAPMLETGRFYVADYEFLTRGKADAGSWLGVTKHLFSPVAVFAYFPPIAHFPARLMPVLIRLGQNATDRVVTPLDGNAWMRAKTAVQVADLIWHEARAHLGLTHLVMEAVAISSERSLASCHPLKLLLAPHYDFTLAINDFAKHHLISPGGQVDQYMATTIASFIGASGTALADFDLEAMLPEREIASRNVADSAALPIYPYRDDVLPVWRAIRRFVDAYVRLYYVDDLAVQADTELQDFRRELASHDGGRLPRIPEMQSREQLITMMAFFIFTASAQHSAVNYPQWPFMGYVPNMPAAAYADVLPPMHIEGGETLEESLRIPSLRDPALVAMLPSYSQSIGQLSLLYLLSGIRHNHLGEFAPGHFTDLRVLSVLRRFKDELSGIEGDTKARDVRRPMTYPYLLPSNIARSVHI